MSVGERLTSRIVRRIPTPILAAPEQILLNFACALIGLNVFVTIPPGSVLRTWPRWAAWEWGVAMLVGGVCALYGILRDRRMAARLGFLLVGGACTIYAAAILFVTEWRGLPGAVVFLGIAGAKAIRLMAGSAHRAEVIRAGRWLEQRK